MLLLNNTQGKYYNLIWSFFGCMKGSQKQEFGAHTAE